LNNTDTHDSAIATTIKDITGKLKGTGYHARLSGQSVVIVKDRTGLAVRLFTQTVQALQYTDGIRDGYDTAKEDAQ